MVSIWWWPKQALKEKEIEDNTNVVFNSDHGDALGSHGIIVSKIRPDLESIRVPDFTAGAWKENKPNMDINLENGSGDTQVLK